ncbi:MAG: rhomboid family intramembrane serine protease [Pseudobdellovibrionaceae bacterium]
MKNKIWQELSRFWGTFSIIAILLLVYFFQSYFLHVSYMHRSFEDVLRIGGSLRINVVDQGQYWRLLSSVFTHINLDHLLANALGLFIVGVRVEEKMGSLNTILMFCISGLIGAVYSIFYIPMGTVSAGASGGVFGLYGVFFCLLPYWRSLNISKYSIFLSLVFICKSFVTAQAADGIDHYAHAGGFLAGLIVGSIAFYLLEKNKTEMSILTVSIFVVVLFVSKVFLPLSSAFKNDALIERSTRLYTIISNYEDFLNQKALQNDLHSSIKEKEIEASKKILSFSMTIKNDILSGHWRSTDALTYKTKSYFLQSIQARIDLIDGILIFYNRGNDPSTLLDSKLLNEKNKFLSKNAEYEKLGLEFVKNYEQNIYPQLKKALRLPAADQK